MTRWLTDSWYQPSLTRWLLTPLSVLYRLVIGCRRLLYKYQILPVERLPVPVIVVGNLTVGGTGKTPLVIELVKVLQQQGWQPGVISRGYGGRSPSYPLVLSDNTTSDIAGDEPVLIKHATACPVVVAPDRVAAGRTLLAAEKHCDVIVADDGLQHYRLARNIEIVVIDGKRFFGNRHCLPSGPLREPLNRLQEVDFQVLHNARKVGAYTMSTGIELAVNLRTSQTQSLSAFNGQPLHAVAGIGHPQRFFDALTDYGLNVIPHAFDDHHHYSAVDFDFQDDSPVLMTEKDAVKCQDIAQTHWWSVPLNAQLDAAFVKAVTDKLRTFYG